MGASARETASRDVVLKADRCAKGGSCAMVFHRQTQGLDDGADVSPGGDGFGDLVEVAEEHEMLAVAVLPEVGAVHQVLHRAVGFRAAAEQLESVIKVARDAVGELVALVGGQVVPASEVGAGEFGRELGTGFVGFDRAKQGFVHPRSAEYGRVRRKQILITSQTQKLPGSSLPLTVPLSKEKFEEQLRFKLSKAAPANPLGSKKP